VGAGGAAECGADGTDLRLQAAPGCGAARGPDPHSSTLAREGHASLADGRVPAAHELLTTALDLWRGRAYDEFDGVTALEAERTRLAGVHLDAVQDRVDADLATGSGSSSPN
jgi:hypothetical protein